MKRLIRRAVWGLLAAGAMVAVGVAAAQQPGGDDGGGGFAMGSRGRMVRGTVTATAADHLTVKTEAGETYQVVVTTNTRMMKERQPVKLEDVHVGDGVGAMGVIDAPTKTVHAAMLFVVDAAEVKKLKEDMGKTYISGRVTAIKIDDLQLTIHRQDGVDQTITVDEGTSFKKGGRGAGMAMRGGGMGAGGTGEASGSAGGGESITLADVKVGDMVVGPGALKAGVFVPTQLTVLDAASMGRRRRGEGASAGGDAAPAGANPH
jgi:hypothetical protein